jgi:hypothetical protein
LLAVEPSPFDPSAELLVAFLLPGAPDLFELDCAVCRSPKRFCVPRIDPRLEAGAPGAPEAAVCPVTAVLVLVAAPTVELPAAEVDAEDDEVLELEVVLDEDDDELELALPARDFVPPLP